jgi:23S rRNA pseudouridine2605 synthase
MKSKAVMTLDRVLSRYGIASRAQARQAILSGRVKVNGWIVRDPDRWTLPEEEPVHMDGSLLKKTRAVYLLLYKPKGVITSHGDPSGRKTIYDLLEKKTPWVSPVGRLDKDTSGLILLTNDTDFADHITDPKSEVAKVYVVKANCLVSDDQLNLLRAGIEMKRGDWAKPQGVRRLEDRGKYSWIEVVLTEGKNREVRRMMEAVGLKVLKLVRTRIGPCTLEGLQVGQSRPLLASEVSQFR